MDLKKYIQHSNFKKGLCLLLISHFIALPIITEANDLSVLYAFNDEIQKDISPSQRDGYLSQDINITLKKLKTELHDRANDYTSNTRGDGSCEIIISLDDNGYVGYAGSLMNQEIFKPLLLPKTKIEYDIMQKLMVLHEASHCDFLKIEQPILVKNNPALQKSINYFYRDSSFIKDISYKTSKINNSIYQILNENFADIYAAMQIIKQYGSNNEVLAMINKFKVQRHEQGLVFEFNNGVDSHITHYGLDFILQSENIKKIQNIHSEQELKYFALEVANFSLGNILINNNIDYIVNKESILSGIVEQIERIKSQKYIIEKDNYSLISNYHFNNNENNSFTFKVANRLLRSKEYNNYLKLEGISEKEIFIENFIKQKNKKDIKNLYNYIYSFNLQYKHFIQNNFVSNPIDNITNTQLPLQERIDIIKRDFLNSSMMNEATNEKETYSI